MSRKMKFLAGGAGLGALAVMLGAHAFAQAPGIYNMEQSTEGHSAYVASCAGCHRANLAGGGDAPALGGAGFMASFGNRSTKDLYNFIAKSMPVGAPVTTTAIRISITGTADAWARLVEVEVWTP